MGKTLTLQVKTLLHSVTTDMNAQQKTETLVNKLYEEAVGSCSCLTKTPEVSAHAEDCKYRILMDRAARLEPVLGYKESQTEEEGAEHKRSGLVKNLWVGENEESLSPVNAKDKLFHYGSQSVVLAAVLAGAYDLWRLCDSIRLAIPCSIAVIGLLLCLVVREVHFRRCRFERTVL